MSILSCVFLRNQPPVYASVLLSNQPQFACTAHVQLLRLPFMHYPSQITFQTLRKTRNVASHTHQFLCTYISTPSIMLRIVPFCMHIAFLHSYSLSRSTYPIDMTTRERARCRSSTFIAKLRDRLKDITKYNNRCRCTLRSSRPPGNNVPYG